MLMKRFHIALAVRNLDDSIADYSARLGQSPQLVVQDKYALWRTRQLNFSINELPEQAGQVRHIGFEDDEAKGFTISKDANGIEWENFSSTDQEALIESIYGEPTYAMVGINMDAVELIRN
jgi:catechol 2,3-dioxygenase-like lactoylglutathione lyase family enzyme